MEEASNGDMYFDETNGIFYTKTSKGWEPSEEDPILAGLAKTQRILLDRAKGGLCKE
jgi:hypothetical protein